LVPAWDISQQSTDAYKERITQLYFSGSAPAGNDDHQTTPPPDEDKEDDLVLILKVLRLSDDGSDTRVGELDLREESSANDDDNLAALLIARYLLAVRTPGFL